MQVILKLDCLWISGILDFVRTGSSDKTVANFSQLSLSVDHTVWDKQIASSSLFTIPDCYSGPGCIHELIGCGYNGFLEGLSHQLVKRLRRLGESRHAGAEKKG